MIITNHRCKIIHTVFNVGKKHSSIKMAIMANIIQYSKNPTKLDENPSKGLRRVVRTMCRLICMQEKNCQN